VFKLSCNDSQTSIPDGSDLKLGRAQSNDIVCDDREASRFHGEFKVQSGQLTYRDLESTNRTLVNGEKVAPYMWQILTDGHTVQIGDWVATVVVVEEKASTSAKREHKLPMPTVDPAGPTSASEVTGRHVIPPELRADK